jgi:hypothetical protein
MMVQDGIARVPFVALSAEISFPGIMSSPARVDRVEKFAGASVGSAVVQFRVPYAHKGQIGFGKSASIRVGGVYIFRGTVGTSPVYVGGEDDFVEAVLYDDKWGMQANIVGQRGIGTLPAPDKGFPDVGFEVIFNRDGRPNKDGDKLNFSTGSGAEFWTLKKALEFIFKYYIAEDVATLAADDLDDAFDRVPSHLACVGQTGMAAVDAICQVAGRSWGLKAGAGASKFVLVKPGGNSKRSAYFFEPLGKRVVTEAGEWHASSATIQGSILHARDVHQARSGRIVIETTIQTGGDSPLLKKETFQTGKFKARFVSDVTKYAANSLGKNLSAGSPAKPWLSALVTRTGVGTYQTAADLSAGLGLGNPRAEIPVWVSPDGQSENLRLAVDGYEIDYDAGLIDFEASVGFIGAGGSKEVVAIDWSKAGVVATVAVVLEYPQFVESDADGSYLPKAFYVVIDKPDLVPEWRLKSRLPDVTSDDPDDHITVAPTLEKYIDVEDRLQDAVDASLASMQQVETPITVEFPLFPLCEIGDALKISGRNLGATGDEVIVAIRYAVHDAYRTTVEATNVTAAINPERFVRG